MYRRRLAETDRERLFLSSIGFFTAALVVRAITFAIRIDIGSLLCWLAGKTWFKPSGLGSSPFPQLHTSRYIANETMENGV